MKNLALFVTLSMALVATGCGNSGDPAANADKAPEGAPPTTTPVPTEPGKLPVQSSSGGGGNAPRATGRN